MNLNMYHNSVWLAFISLLHVTFANVVVLRENNVTEADYVSYGAFFGSVVDSDGITGYLVASDPPDACGTIVPRSNFDKNVTRPRKWIALIRRGKCSFSKKVWYAQEAGFDAAIVHNVGGESLIHMSGSGDDNVHIPSVFIGEREGVDLREQYLWDTGFYVVVTDEFPIININTILLPFAIVVGVCFLMLFGFVVGRWIRERRRQQRHRLPKRELRKIPTKKYAEGDKYDVCAICLEQFAVGEKVRVLPCDHMYHIKCIDPWLLHSKRVCPVCKQKVIPGDHSDSEDDAEHPTHTVPVGIHRPTARIVSVSAASSLPGPSGASSSSINNNNNNDSVLVIQRENLVRRSSANFSTPDCSTIMPGISSSLDTEIAAGSFMPKNNESISSSLPVCAGFGSINNDDDDAVKLRENVEPSVAMDAEMDSRTLTESPSLLQRLVAGSSDESMMPLLHVPGNLTPNNVANLQQFPHDSSSSSLRENLRRFDRGRSASQTHDSLNRDFSLATAAVPKLFDRSTSTAAAGSGGSGSKRSSSSFYVNKSFDASFDMNDSGHQASTNSSRNNNKFLHRKHGSLTTTVIADVTNHRQRLADDETASESRLKAEQQDVTADKVQHAVIRRKKQRYDSTVSTETNQSYIVGDDVIVAADDESTSTTGNADAAQHK